MEILIARLITKLVHQLTMKKGKSMFWISKAFKEEFPCQKN